MKKASIDLGTNTCLLLIKEDLPSGEVILHDESQVVRLGQEVDRTRMLQPEAMDRAYACLEKYAETIRSYGLDPAAVLAVATAQARDAQNSAPFFKKIETHLGFRFRVLTGDQEAKATFLGAAPAGSSTKNRMVMDIGGGSTEIVSAQGGQSLQIGAVRMTERYLKSDPVTDDEFWNCESAIDEQLSQMLPLRKSMNAPEFIAVAGTAVTLAMLQLQSSEYRREVIDGFELTRGDAHRLVEELKWRSIAERKQMPGMEPKRADVILAGALIFWRAMEVLDLPSVKVSTRGLRYGVFQLS